jgi:ABC-type branched-subunit amino acid transport system ATPase component/predicted MFS family arabinose efflux permease
VNLAGGPRLSDSDVTTTVAASVMVQAVLDAEAERESAAAEAAAPVLFADELLPGVGGEELSLKEGLARGGTFTFLVLLVLYAFEQLEGAALSVLAPDIRDSFHVGDGVIVFIASATGACIVLGSLPMGWLADRYRRGPIIGWASVFFATMVFTSGLAVNAFTLFLARFGVGIGRSNTVAVHPSLLADAYPIGVRGRMNGAITVFGSIVAVASPAAVGVIAAVAGGDEGWRWPFLILGLPVLALAVLAFKVPEPPRGQYEMLDVLGEVTGDRSANLVSVEAAFARLRQIRTLRIVLLAFAAIGFGLFTGPVLASLWVQDRFDLDALQRGLLGSLGGIGVVVVVPFAARRYDALYREDPAKALRLIGLLILPVAVLTPIQYVMPNAIAFALAGVPPTVLLITAFSMAVPVLQSVVPYRLRGMGAAYGGIYIFFIGATGGALLAAFFVGALDARAAVLLLVVPSTIVGGAFVLRSASFIKHDLSLVVAELREELAEQERQRADPGAIPAIQVADVDFAYGPVPVLFDVGFEVRKGEVLALLGTNGAGKSTILRVIAGLGTPSRGVVRLHGQTITYVTAEARVRMGVQLLPGGKGVFPGMTVGENLEMGAYLYRSDRADRDRRIARVLDLFSDLAKRQDQLAGSLSGGQQQMLALAITLLHDPDVLLIDELSLGLSPIVVQDLLGVVERLKGEGMTIVVVEQSLNVALAIADRAVFLEKGEVRFEGSTAELAERDDLARAVFLGHEGG